MEILIRNKNGGGSNEEMVEMSQDYSESSFHGGVALVLKCGAA